LGYERLVDKITKENLWLYILRMLMDRPMYAYEISKTLNERFGFSTAMITVYVVLYKMQKEDLIHLKDIGVIKSGPERKYYEVTESGKEAFRKGREFLENIAKKLSTEPSE
jgi:PadR family transcriptional regulator PadR